MDGCNSGEARSARVPKVQSTQRVPISQAKGQRSLEYLTGGNMKVVKCYRWLYIFAVFAGPYMTVKAVWTIADIFNGLMALPNMIALFALSGVVAAETKRFFSKQQTANVQTSPMVSSMPEP